MKNREFIEQWVTTLGLDHENTAKIEQFDDRKYRFSLYLLNQDGYAIKIRKGAIHELYIEDNIMDWFHHGHVTMLNPDDIMERAESIFLGDSINDQAVATVPYRFRGDCRDLLLLTFEPHIDPGQPGESVPEALDNMVYTMKFLFTVYATEDVLSDSGRRDKKQKMYFHDYRYQMLREKNIYYSTARNPVTGGSHTKTTTPVTQMNDTNRAKPTGEIIQDIIRTALLPTDTQDLFSYHWNWGGTNLFYTSPSNFKAIDDLNYIMDRHVSSSDYEYQPCLFKLQRYTERWELLPITEYFVRSKDGLFPGVYQSEYFLLSNDSEPDKVTIPPERKTFGRSVKTPMNNYHFPDVSVVDDYIFSEMNGVDCQETLNSVIVHRYDEGNKLFSIDVTDNNISNIQSKFQELYINHTFGGSGGHGVASWLSDTSRSMNFNFNVKSSWTSNVDASRTVARNKMLLGAFLLGNTIQFDARGETSRRSGVWIALDRDTNYIDNAYEMKVLGQYFVTRVTHTITSTGEYKNNIMGVKPYFYQELTFKTEDLFMKNTDMTPTV
jgi:hypothetical protein